VSEIKIVIFYFLVNDDNRENVLFVVISNSFDFKIILVIIKIPIPISPAIIVSKNNPINVLVSEILPNSLMAK